MRLFPTRSALDLAIAGAAIVLGGILLFQPAIVAWGGALILGLCVARALTLVHVVRVRAAGFEMVWRSTGRCLRAVKGETTTLVAEVRNRDTRAARYVQLRLLASPELAIEVEPDSGEVPAGGRLEIAVRVKPRRVGRHGVFGLGLELRGGPGLFEVPLTFSNPLGLEVLPRTSAMHGVRLGVRTVRAGVKASRRSGETTEFSEIRDHQLGDPLKRVAWKASARRGKLMVRKYEVEERDVIWFVLDASVELWAGRAGAAPLDLAIDGTGDLVRQHLRAGHEVGLSTVADGAVSRVPLGRGGGHARRLLEALALTPAMLEPARSGLDERGVAARVLEHLRALAPAEAQKLDVGDLDAIAALAARTLPQAPFPDARIDGGAARETALRSYMAGFGLSGPPRLEPKRPSTDALLVDTAITLCRGRDAATLIYLVSPIPDETRWQELAPRLRRIPRRRTHIRWLHALDIPGLDMPSDAMGRVARTAARLRSSSERDGGRERLRRLGIRAITINPFDSAAPMHPPRRRRLAPAAE